MAYLVTSSKEESFAQLKMLVSTFKREFSVLKSPRYNEAQLRNDFLNPLLKTFGWDVENEAGKTQFLRDVIQEESIDVDEEDGLTKKNPDYTLRIGGTRKLFIEAKKVSVEISRSSKAAFQTRRYGWSANLGISILTNFEYIIVYDCRSRPLSTDNAHVAKYISFHYTEFEKNFDLLFSLLSYQSVATGYIDHYFSLTENEVKTFDAYFLEQIEVWRKRLATEIISKNDGFSEDDINFLVQRLLNRIVFLRICEDREIEKYYVLGNTKNYDELKDVFILADKRYNSGLFDFIEDNISLGLIIDSDILVKIFNELYYPESPYDFSVVDPTILSQIYERYLGSKITIINGKEIAIVEEPEVSATNGVVPTPRLIVENIVKETLHSLVEHKNLEAIEKLKIADICCGSGTFLISVYNYLVEKVTLTLVEAGMNDEDIIYVKADGSYHLSLKAKQNILLKNIYGVDINPYAVEVTKFSLLLKLLENENAASVANFLTRHRQKVLPNLAQNIKNGNSLVDNTFFEFDTGAINNNGKLYKVKPFNWKDEFPFLNETGGFDAIVGNPPYVRIQNMVQYLEDEIKYYQSKYSGYTVAQSDAFDKYYLFVQKGIELLNDTGVLGYIIPNKFFITKGGKSLRSYIVKHASLYKIVHFGVTQVFPNRSTYTSILVLDKKKRARFGFTRIRDLGGGFLPGSLAFTEYANDAYTESPWIFVSEEVGSVFNKMKSGLVIPLKEIAEIPVGLQTSADKVYIIEPEEETETTFRFRKNSISYEIEKAICRPCLYDLSFELFDLINPNAQMIFPYDIVDAKAVVFDEESFSLRYPLTWAYLNTFKETLSRRSINGTKEPKWYQFGRSQSLTKFHDVPKLIWPVLSKGPCYGYDLQNILFTGGGNGPYYSLVSHSQYSPLYLAGILAHPVIEAMVRAGASEFRGAYYSHGKQFMENLPIRQIDFLNEADKQRHDAVVRNVEQLIAVQAASKNVHHPAMKNVEQRRYDYLFKTLIAQVNELYGLTQADINHVTSDDIFVAVENEI